MTQRAGIQPYFMNHSLRATTVTVLSSVNMETRQIKAVTSHKSKASIESYCERPTLRQFQHMSSALTSFKHGKENTGYQSKLCRLQAVLNYWVNQSSPKHSSWSSSGSNDSNQHFHHSTQTKPLHCQWCKPKCNSTIGQVSWYSSILTSTSNC